MFAYLLSKVTGTQRYRPVIEWSGGKCFVHDVFRAYEYLFGRKFGIRPEMFAARYQNETGLDTVVLKFHSWEALLAFGESYVRSLFTQEKKQWVTVGVPQFAFNGSKMMRGDTTKNPYLFAIAFDSYAEQALGVNNTTITQALTTSGSDRVINMTIRTSPATNTLASNTYAGAAATTVDMRNTDVNTNLYLTYRIAPSTGSNNMVATQTPGSGLMSIIGASYTGVSQTGYPDSSNKDGGLAATALSLTLTAVASSTWASCAYDSNSGAVTAGSNTTLRGTNPSTLSKTMGDSNGATITPGVGFTMAATMPLGGWSMIGVTMAPAGVATTIKTYNGVATANVKTVLNGTAIANRKTWNGIT